jgi:hypothetical protein
MMRLRLKQKLMENRKKEFFKSHELDLEVLIEYYIWFLFVYGKSS